MKKTISALLLVTLFVSFFNMSQINNNAGTSVSQAGRLSEYFSDVSDTAWYKEELLFSIDMDMIVGYEDGSFRPNGELNVDALLKILVKAEDDSIEPSLGYWAQSFIEEAMVLGYIGVDTFDSYRRIITRGEVANVLINIIKSKSIVDFGDYERCSSLIKDYGEIKDGEQDNILKCYNLGLLKGDEKGAFNSNASLKRSEAVVVIYRLIKMLESGFVPLYSKQATVSVEKEFEISKVEVSNIHQESIGQSDVAQTISAPGISVTVPGSVLSKTEQVVIEIVDNPEYISQVMNQSSSTESYNITIGDQHLFSKNLQITLDLSGDYLKSGKTPLVYSYNEESKRWETEESEIVNNQLVINTNHLSYYTIYWDHVKYTSPNGTLAYYYNRDDKFSVDDDQSIQSMDELVLRLDSMLGNVIKKYNEELGSKYALSAKEITININSSFNGGNPYYSVYTGSINIPTSFTSLGSGGVEIAHEVFHYYQNTKMSMFEMDRERWLIEAMTDYASYVIAFNRIPIIQEAVDLSLELVTEDSSHEYGMSSFIGFILRKYNKSFGDLHAFLVENEAYYKEGILVKFLGLKSEALLQEDYKLFWEDTITNPQLYRFYSVMPNYHFNKISFSTLFNDTIPIDIDNEYGVELLNVFIGGNAKIDRQRFIQVSTNRSSAEYSIRMFDNNDKGATSWNLVKDSSSKSYVYELNAGRGFNVMARSEGIYNIELNEVSSRVNNGTGKYNNVIKLEDFQVSYTYSGIFDHIDKLLVETDFGDGSVMFDEYNGTSELSLNVNHTYQLNAKDGNITCKLYDISTTKKVQIARLVIPITFDHSLPTSNTVNVSGKDIVLQEDLGNDSCSIYYINDVMIKKGEETSSISMLALDPEDPRNPLINLRPTNIIFSSPGIVSSSNYNTNAINLTGVKEGYGYMDAKSIEGQLSSNRLGISVYSESDVDKSITFDKYNLRTSHSTTEFVNLNIQGNSINVTGILNDSMSDWVNVSISDVSYSYFDAESEWIEVRDDYTFSGEIDVNKVDGIYYLKVYTDSSENSKILGSTYTGIKIEVKGGVLTFLQNTAYDKNNDIFYNTPKNITGIPVPTKEMYQVLLNITAGKTTDSQKVLAVHDWVAENLYVVSNTGSQSISKEQIWAYADINNVFKTKVGNKKSYANVFAVMVGTLNIPNRIVYGYGKIYAAMESVVERNYLVYARTENVWNEVYVDGRWIIVDTYADSSNRYTDGQYIYGGFNRVAYDPTIEWFSSHYAIYDEFITSIWPFKRK